MNIKRTIDGWVLTVALALIALPLSGLYSFSSSPKVVGADNGEDTIRISLIATRLSRQIGKLEQRGGIELAAHTLSVHSRIPANQLLSGGALRDSGIAAMAARITGQTLDYVSGRVATGATIEQLIVSSGADIDDASSLMAAAVVGVKLNRKNVSNSLLDFDGDGIANGLDPDVDNDGLLNQDDRDIDGDGLPNSLDQDIDADGMPNGRDDDTDGDAIANYDDRDIDADGIVNEADGDMDGDGVVNADDEDADGDGLNDENDRELVALDSGSGSDDDDDDGNSNGNGNDNGNGNGNGNANGNENGNGNGNGNANGNENGNGNGNGNAKRKRKR